MNLNEALRLLRVYNDMKIKDLSKEIGLTASYICEIEKVKKTPSIDTLTAYATFLKISVGDIMRIAENVEAFKRHVKRGMTNFLDKKKALAREAKDANS